MKWKSLKRGLAVVLSALLITSSVSVYADDTGQSPPEPTEVVSSAVDAGGGDSEEPGTGEVVETPSSESKPEESSTPDETESTEESSSTDETESTEENSTPDETESTEESSSTDETESTEESSTPDETESTEESSSTDETESTEESSSTDETESAENVDTVLNSFSVFATAELPFTETETETETGTESVSLDDIEDKVAYKTDADSEWIYVIPQEFYSDELVQECQNRNITVKSFDEDGNFIIEVESYAYLPGEAYEVKFQYGDKTENKQFYNTNSYVSVGGYRFYIQVVKTESVSVAFDDIKDKVAYDTGSGLVWVIPQECYSEELRQECQNKNITVKPFKEDGNFAIEVESYTYLPGEAYEVKFQYGDKTENKQFYNTNSYVSVRDHIFYIQLVKTESIVSFDAIKNKVAYKIDTDSDWIYVVPKECYSDQLIKECQEKNITVKPFEEEGNFTIDVGSYASLPGESYEIQFQYGDREPVRRTFSYKNDYAYICEHKFSIQAEDNKVGYNTGNGWIYAIPNERYSEELAEKMLEDRKIYVTPFNEDGSLTIEAEPDAFFPYEVKFHYDGKNESRWFLSPNDRVTVDGHTFTIHSEFSGEVITQMNLSVAGQTVVVYPEQKSFKSDGWTSTYSLMPLEEKKLTANLTGLGLTPLQLTRVAMKDVFVGEKQINPEKIAWSLSGSDDYKITSAGGEINLSYRTSYGGATWEIIAGTAGDADQLNQANVRYMLQIITDDSSNWLNPIVRKQNSDGSLTENLVTKAEYDDWYSSSGRDHWDRYRRKNIHLKNNIVTKDDIVYLKLDRAVLGSNVKAYQGRINNPNDVAQAEEITGEIFGEKGYVVSAEGRYGFSWYYASWDDCWITLVNCDDSGKAMGCLPMEIEIYARDEYFDFNVRTTDNTSCSSHSSIEDRTDGYWYSTHTLNQGYSADAQYFLKATHYLEGSSSSDISEITVVKGLYNTLAEARNANAEEITSAILGDGYLGNYSQGVDFTFFTSGQVFQYNVKVVPWIPSVTSANSGVSLGVSGLVDKDGTPVEAYVMNAGEDSYAERSYLTILVNNDVDLKNLALVFNASSGAKVYCEGSSQPEESGKTFHDFSKGVMHYTVSAEDGEHKKEYSVQVVKMDTGNKKLYINSLIDPDAKTEVRDGVIYTTREVMLDGLNDYVHDIVLANVGNADISKLSVELNSDVVALDEYWRLEGNQNLGTFKSEEIHDDKVYGELSNLAKIRLIKKDGVADGTDVTGTLTVREDGKDMIVMELTGTVGNPTIITTEIPDAVKYVPFGTMIQDSNKYSKNSTFYRLYSGRLPDGMVLKSNGEIYGVPREAGTFHITVGMSNSLNGLSSCSREYDFVVLENTDENVDNATDEGYMLSMRLRKMESSPDYLVVSDGIYTNFKYIYIDGEQLEEGVDFDAESGSTRITIRSETINKKGAGTHTLGIEFREGGDDTGTLKRAAQNYDTEKLDEPPANDDSNSSSSDNSNSSSSSSDSSSPSNNAAAVSSSSNAPIEVVPVEGFTFKEGFTVSQADLSQDKLLKMELLSRYYGQNMYLNVFFGADFGLTIDMSGVTVVSEDIEINYVVVTDPTITSEFNVVHAIPDAIKPLGFNAVFNFHVGDAYIGKKAYIYVLNENGTGYDLAGTSIVNEIGNIAFVSDKVTDVIIFIEK